MKIKLERIFRGETYTIGHLYIDDVYFCDTVEDAVREIKPDGEGKIFGQTAIPHGTYKVILSMSAKFKRILPSILDVPHFTGIRIHSGNTAKDSHGCILVGKNTEKGKVTSSRIYEQVLIKKIQGATNIEITIS